MNLHTPSRRKAFTLIELMLVIAIIATLIGLLLPALKGSRDQAKRAKTKTLMNGLNLALKAYYNEYGFWPNTSGILTADATLTTEQNMNLYYMLNGSNVWLDGVIGGNPRRIPFLDVKISDLGRVDSATYLKSTSVSGTSSNNIVNPFGNALIVVIDYDGDSVVTPYASNKYPSGGPVKAPVAIYSYTTGTITNITWAN